MRKKEYWQNGWYFSKTDQIPVSLPKDWQQVVLPHTWNAEDGQDGGNDYWRGTAIYARKFPRPEMETDGRAVLEFAGAAMTADIYLNGQHLTHHEGGYSTFRVDITQALEDDNLLCVAVDNSENDRVYPQKADFTFYGGLYRQVNLITVPSEHFELIKDGTPGIKVTPVVQGRSAVVCVETWQTGGELVKVQIGSLVRFAQIKDGKACTSVVIEDCHLWDGVADPYLYTATATLMRDGCAVDEISTRFGCRSIHFDPQKGFLLNGRHYLLRGISRHQDRAGIGNALTIDHHREDLELIREIGATTVRLAHYQHAQEFYDLCDEFGFIVWAEIPYITLHMPNGRENTISQMRELITQCYNHPSIVCWGLSNEITASSRVDDDLLDNHRELRNLCSAMDVTRPTTMAHAFMLEQSSPLIPMADLASYNLYFGWYLGELTQNEEFFDEYHTKYPDRCIGFSEYGADANPRFQSSEPDRGDYSEQYQCLYHEHILKVIEERPWLWATHVWNMFDFAADGRDEGGAHGVNQKGLVSMDRTLKKDAFYLYKAAWNKKEPFVHICGSRYVDRPEETTEVKVYSNLDSVTLRVDGRELETQKGATIFTFNIPLSGEHQIEARSGACSDTITVRKVSEPNPAYSMGQRSNIINWFDKEDFMPGFFSIRDKFGELMANPETAPLVGKVMAMARASRGDVAKSTEGNANLEAMLAKMPFQSLIKQAGEAVPKEAVLALNAALQKVCKPE